jgi:hypothetical protein
LALYNSNRVLYLTVVFISAALVGLNVADSFLTPFNELFLRPYNIEKYNKERYKERAFKYLLLIYILLYLTGFDVQRPEGCVLLCV